MRLKQQIISPSVDFEGWDDSDWGWKDEEETESPEENNSLSWLQECHVSLSPACELMALANDDRLVLLARKLLLGYKMNLIIFNFVDLCLRA